ncbi:IspD/TarI family cytidylyltransferase [Pseudonocardia xinjiangensis]|uniref:2-C-methyl-D-erythritol 4-phosphate cytidylyltransferase n=1 Tax=Pseudonocardia xinjiangensis TaxID=75289 RepID=A0ABX1RHC9_9PSEU|nr:2-C-methyl-D-erythritol 4-phosphate cytidylyltransferase [Pseudonocardia xinjiangensis]NMH79798.1 2-C-methyl-D-erythritol 4-phosphate cytidylyltransferase [Pseudonocardia xinjiangensis]
MNVTAVVVAGGGRGEVDALTTVGGEPMVVRSVRSLLATGLIDHVVLLDVDARPDALMSACSGLPVSTRSALAHALSGIGPHVGQRAGTTAGDGPVTAGSADVVLLHEAARPFAPAALATTVVTAVRDGHEMAVPVLPLVDTVKQVDAAGLVQATPDRSGLRVLQTPLAVRGDLFDPLLAPEPLELARRHAAAGGAVHTVPGHSAAFPVRSAWDLELAELLAGRDDG